jgi:hypothetical protein
MIAIGKWIIDNWQLVVTLGVLLIILSMTGTITQSYKAAKRGLKEAMTPMGFLIFLGIVYIAYRIYLSIMEAI